MIRPLPPGAPRLAFLVSMVWFALAGATARGATPDATATEQRYLSGTGPEDAVEWEFFCTDGRRSGEWTTIPVPSCWEQEGFGSYYYGVQRRGRPDDDPGIPREVGRYRHTFSVPAEWEGRQVRIVFEAAMTDTTVTINGQSAGPTHQGGFYQFHYDITGLLRYGSADNLLEVTVAKESAIASVNHAERRGDYWTFGGIYRPVWIEARPREHIEWTAIDARADGSFYAQVHLGAAAPAGARVVAELLGGDEGTGKPAAIAAPVAIHGTQAVVRGRFEGVRAWSAETPHLYRVRFTLTAADGTPLHVVTERCGFRTLEVRPRDGVYLNGAKIVLKGINRHCFDPDTGRTISRAQSYADARLIKAANMNAVRMSHYPPDTHFLEACDELGLYVLDELAGWQGSYDTAVGARLIGQIVRRDVNHPSILFWDNGNEGGWNREVDGEFDRWDPQRRPVLHPWALHSGINTDHYEKYDSTVRLSAGPDIFMPTEFLHGLYDGGMGAGLRDYWDVMGRSPTCAGGFFWVWSDESVARTDRDGWMDGVGNSAPDGIVGPRRELEGSYFTVKEIWSPVQVEMPAELDRAGAWDGRVSVENRYDFHDLAACQFRWELVRFAATDDAAATGHEIIAVSTVAGPPVPPDGRGEVAHGFAPEAWRSADAVHLTVLDPDGSELWTWSARVVGATGDGTPLASARGAQPVVVTEEPAALVLTRGDLVVRFDRATGQLASVRRGGREFALAHGPRLVAFRREDRNFSAVGATSALRALQTSREGDDVLVTADYGDALRTTWRLTAATGELTLRYTYTHEGTVDLLGVAFDLPEERVPAKRWLGRGPYRVYQNRLEGGVLDVWQCDWNNPVPGAAWDYPEFTGWFRDWQWLDLHTTDGRVVVERTAEDGSTAAPYLGLYRPLMGDGGLLEFPDLDLAFLDVIPAQRTKFDAPETLGPQSQPHTVSGERRGALRFRFFE